MPPRRPLGGGHRRASRSPGSSGVPSSLPPSAAPRPSEVARRPLVRIKRPSNILGCFSYLVVLTAIVAGAWYYQVVDVVYPNSPRATAKAFMRAIYDGDMDRAGELCTAATQPLMAPLKQAAKPAQSSAQTEHPKELSWRATAVEVTGDRATVTVGQTLKEGTSVQSLTLPLALAKENSKWRVDLTGGIEPLKGLSGLSGIGLV